MIQRARPSGPLPALTRLGKAPTDDALLAALRPLADAFAATDDPLDCALLRARAIRALLRANVAAPVRMIDAALREANQRRRLNGHGRRRLRHE